MRLVTEPVVHYVNHYFDNAAICIQHTEEPYFGVTPEKDKNTGEVRCFWFLIENYRNIETLFKHILPTLVKGTELYQVSPKSVFELLHRFGGTVEWNNTGISFDEQWVETGTARDGLSKRKQSIQYASDIISQGRGSELFKLKYISHKNEFDAFSDTHKSRFVKLDDDTYIDVNFQGTTAIQHIKELRDILAES